MVPNLRHISMVQDNNLVGVPNCGEAVGDDDRGAPLEHSLQGPLYQQLGIGVDVGGGLVQNDYLCAVER